MSRGSLFCVCGAVVFAGLLVVPAARPQQRDAEAPADPVRQQLRDLRDSQHFAEESLTRYHDERDTRFQIQFMGRAF